MSKLMYCALGDYGIEYVAETEELCQKWIDDVVESSKHDGKFNIEIESDYYQIVTHTQDELDAMPDV